MLVCVLTASTVVRADDQSSPAEPNSGGTAFALSLGGTIGSVGLIAAAVSRDGHPPQSTILAGAGVAGLLLAPSMGEWYSDEFLTPGLGLRVAGPVIALVGLGAFPCHQLGDGSGCNTLGPAQNAALVVGAGAFIAGVAYDIWDAPRAAGRYNRSHSSVAVTPMTMRGPSGSPAYGLYFSATY